MQCVRKGIMMDQFENCKGKWSWQLKKTCLFTHLILQSINCARKSGKMFWSDSATTVFLHSKFRTGLKVDLVAQLVEHNTFNVGALGSSPSGITNKSLGRCKSATFLFLLNYHSTHFLLFSSFYPFSLETLLSPFGLRAGCGRLFRMIVSIKKTNSSYSQ